MLIPMLKCKKKLAILWFIGAGLSFFLLLLQTLGGRYGDDIEKAWRWLLPTIIPTLSLIIGVLAIEFQGSKKDGKMADRFFFRLSYILSTVYLCIVALTILWQPFSNIKPLALLEQSNLWLGPFQGLVSATIGAFFVKK